MFDASSPVANSAERRLVAYDYDTRVGQVTQPLGRLVIGAVVDHDDLQLHLLLLERRWEGGSGEQMPAVSGRDDDGDRWHVSHGRACGR